MPGLKLGIDSYYKYARNLIDEGQFGAPIILTPFNYHVGYTKGVELTTSYDRGAFPYYGNLRSARKRPRASLRRSTTSSRPTSIISPVTWSTPTIAS